MGVRLREKKLKKSGVSYYLDIIHEGRRWYEFLGIKTDGPMRLPENVEKKRLAKQARSARENDLIVSKNNLPGKEQQEKCLYEFIREKSTHKKGTHHLYLIQKLEDFTGKDVLPISSIDEHFMRGFQNYLKTELSKSTPYHMIYYLSSYMNLAVECKYRKENPYRHLPKAERLKRQKKIPESLTLGEISQLALCDKCDIPEVRLMFLLACFTGLRYSDVSRLKYSQFSQQLTGERTITVLRFTMQKTSADSYIPVSQQGLDILEECKRLSKERQLRTRKESPFLFPEFADESTHQNAYLRAHFALKRWVKKAELKRNVHFHLARHTFATMTLELGADLYTVSKLLGHADIATTTIYAQVGDKLKMQAIENLSKIGGFPKVPDQQDKGAA